MKGQCKSLARIFLLSTGLMLSGLHAAQADNQSCAKTIFYAQTLNHNKEVTICIDTPYVSYSFGKPGAAHKEMDITVPAANTTYAYQSNELISIQEFTVRNGDTRYQVSAGTNDSGEPVASLYVFKGAPDTGKLLADIKLDRDTVVNNISHSLAEDGVIQADSL